MPVSGDPDAASYAAQAKMAGSATNMPGAQPLSPVRAKLTATDGTYCTWNEVEPDLAGNLADKVDGLAGNPSYSPARELNAQPVPFFPWLTWLTPRIDTGDKGVVWDFDLKCCGGPAGGGSIPCLPDCQMPGTLFANLFDGFLIDSTLGVPPPVVDLVIPLNLFVPVPPATPVWFGEFLYPTDNRYIGTLDFEPCVGAICSLSPKPAICDPDAINWRLVSKAAPPLLANITYNNTFCWPCPDRPVSMTPLVGQIAVTADPFFGCLEVTIPGRVEIIVGFNVLGLLFQTATYAYRLAITE